MMQYLAAHWLEWAGVVTTILGIWLTARRNLLCWPIILVSDLLYLVIFYRAALLSDALLQAFFVVFVLYGWWNWSSGVKADGKVKISPLGVGEAAIAIVAGAVGAVILGVIARRMHAALPFVDATLASYSLVGSWWQARRNIANWWLWIVVNAAYVGEYIYKGLWPTALLYVVLAGLAVVGLIDWRRAEREAAQIAD
jgi:nicotinamide mononucleotide transporter